MQNTEGGVVVTGDNDQLLVRTDARVAPDKAAFECDQDPKSPSLRFATDDADPEIAAGLGLKSKSSPRHRGTA